MTKILVERQGAVMTIIINRPGARNAMDLEATELFADALTQFEDDDSVSAGVVWGSGGAFCAGADLREMADEGAVYKPWAGTDGPLARPCSKPLIAAVEGHAVAGGVGVALYCDMRVAATSAVFGIYCRRFGVPMSDGSTVRLPRLIGTGRALDMLNTGRAVEAEEALRIGLVDRVVVDGTARAAAEALAQGIAEFPHVAMRADRWSAIHQAGMSMAEALQAEAEGADEAKRVEAQAGAKRFADGEGRGLGSSERKSQSNQGDGLGGRVVD